MSGFFRARGFVVGLLVSERRKQAEVGVDMAEHLPPIIIARTRLRAS